MLLNTETSSKSIKPQTGVRQYLLIGDIKGNKLEETKIKIYNIQINMKNHHCLRFVYFLHLGNKWI